MKLVGIAALAAVLGIAAALSGVGRPQDARGSSAQAQNKPTITVSGTGSVRAVPDRAQFSFGVTTQAPTASQALNANATLARRVIAAVKAAGVAPADIQTQTVFLAPRFSDDGGAIVGYTAANSVSATLRDLDKAGAVVDAAAEAHARLVDAVVVGAAGREQAVTPDEALQPPPQLGVVLRVPDLDAVDARFHRLGEHPVAFAVAEASRVGQHRDPAGLAGEGHRVGHRDAGCRHVGRPPGRQVAVERLGHVDDHPPGHQRPGEMRPGQGAAARDRGRLLVADPGELQEPRADGEVPLVASAPGDLDRLAEVGGEQALAVQQDVHHPAADQSGELATGQHLDPETPPGDPRLGDRGNGVVVGDRQHLDPGGRRRLDQLARVVAAVAGRGVGMEVDQGRPPADGHGRYERSSLGAVSSPASSQARTCSTDWSTLSVSVWRMISGVSGGS